MEQNIQEQQTQAQPTPVKRPRRIRRHRDLCLDPEIRLASLPADKQDLFWRLAELNGDTHTYA